MLFTREPSPESGIPPALAGAVFSLRDEGNVVTAPLRTGDSVALIQLVEIDRVDITSDEAAMTASQELQDSIGNDLFGAFLAGIQEDVDLRVNQDALASYKARVNPDT